MPDGSRPMTENWLLLANGRTAMNDLYHCETTARNAAIAFCRQHPTTQVLVVRIMAAYAVNNLPVGEIPIAEVVGA